MKGRFWKWSTCKAKPNEQGNYAWDELEDEIGKREISFCLETRWRCFRFMPISISLAWDSLEIAVAVAWLRAELFVRWREWKER